MQSKNLWDVALESLEGQGVNLKLSEFKSFIDVDVGADISNITGSGKGNVVGEDSSIDTEKAQKELDEIKKVFI